jgi:RimJ/RimL family protein N-acetyltransferase
MPEDAPAHEARSRISLRRFQESDAEALHPIFSDPEAMRYWSRPAHRSLDETRAYVQATIDATIAGDGDDQVVLFDGEVIGKAGLWDNREIGFIFARHVWGRGLARTAVEAVIERARARGVERILAEVDPRNAASIGLLTRVGFVKTGEATATAQIGEEWVDSVYFELALA